MNSTAAGCCTEREGGDSADAGAPSSRPSSLGRSHRLNGPLVPSRRARRGAVGRHSLAGMEGAAVVVVLEERTLLWQGRWAQARRLARCLDWGR